MHQEMLDSVLESVDSCRWLGILVEDVVHACFDVLNESEKRNAPSQ